MVCNYVLGLNTFVVGFKSVFNMFVFYKTYKTVFVFDSVGGARAGHFSYVQNLSALMKITLLLFSFCSVQFSFVVVP